MAAAKDGVGMHGVSYDAKIATYAKYMDSAAGLRSFLVLPELCIINHSWYTDAFLEEYPDLDFMEEHDLPTNNAFISLGLANKVNVVAAGNEVHLGPGALIQTSLKTPSITGTMVSVIAANPATDLHAIDMPAIFTNMAFGGAQDVSVVSPGIYIVSAKAGTTNQYYSSSGTSMASPIVTGTLGLVQQAFPYMTNKQLTSTLFSTATKFTPFPYVVVREDAKSEGSEEKDYSIDFVYFGGRSHVANKDADLTAYYTLNAAVLSKYSIPSLQDFLAMPTHITTTPPLPMPLVTATSMRAMPCKAPATSRLPG